MDDPSTNLELNMNLWLEDGSSNRPNRNRVDGIEKIMIEDLQTAHSVSIIECSQSFSITQSSKFQII